MAMLKDEMDLDPPTREQFDLLFYDIGQGDCCLIRCPNNKIVMVDCGCKKDFEVRQNTLRGVVRSKDWAGGNANKVDALILTHPDADHYNRVDDVLGESIVSAKDFVIVEKLYFSSRGTTGALQNYSQGGRSRFAINKSVYRHAYQTTSIHEVTINSADDAKNFYRTWTSKDHFKNSVSDTRVAGKRLEVISGTTTRGKTWGVSILAGNVVKSSNVGKDESGNPLVDHSTDFKNPASLVTLLQFDTSRALICGDATFSTEVFLQRNHSALLAGLDIVQAPHHGSADTSSGPDFVKLTRPKFVAVSVKKRESKHRHPRQDVLKRWLSILTNKASKAHTIDGWRLSDDDLYSQWDTWLPPTYSSENRLKFLTDDSTFFKGSWAMQNLTGGWYVLDRDSTDLALHLTAFGSVPVKLPLA